MPLPYNFYEFRMSVLILSPYIFTISARTSQYYFHISQIDTKKPDGVLKRSLTPAVELAEGFHTVFDMDG